MAAIQRAMTPKNRRKSERVAIPRRSSPGPIKTYSGRSSDRIRIRGGASLRDWGPLPRLGGQVVVREPGRHDLRDPRPGERLDPGRAEDPVVDPPQLPLLDVDLFLAGR